METQITPFNLFERFNRWIQESIMVKLFSIGFLILVLLIPAAWVQNLIDERQQRADEVLGEVADKWSASQTVSGPILVVPYLRQEVVELSDRTKEVHEVTDYAYFLPDQLGVTSQVDPEHLKRGIFDAVVYQSRLTVKSTFSTPNFKALNIPDTKILWNDARLVYGLNDLRGIADNPVFTIDGQALTSEPTNDIGIATTQRSSRDEGHYYETVRDATVPVNATPGIVARPEWTEAPTFPKEVNIALQLKGSARLDFVPCGKTTDVRIASAWTDPSFDGEFLPTSRSVTDSGFTAQWKVLHYNRAFSQQWVGAGRSLANANFGVKLLLPVDQYQKSMRSSKYGVLVVILTFVAMFLLEITQKLRIHPFQYILTGAALIIYYTLLLSFAEHLGYNAAYALASMLTVLLISFYSSTFLPARRLTVLFAGILSITYLFIFVIILQQDYALLLGSLGLFIVLGMLMYFSRKIKWYTQTTTA